LEGRGGGCVSLDKRGGVGEERRSVVEGGVVGKLKGRQGEGVGWKGTRGRNGRISGVEDVVGWGGDAIGGKKAEKEVVKAIVNPELK